MRRYSAIVGINFVEINWQTQDLHTACMLGTCQQLSWSRRLYNVSVTPTECGRHFSFTLVKCYLQTM